MPALHSPSADGPWSDPRQHGSEHRARHDDVAPDTSWGQPPGYEPTGHIPPGSWESTQPTWDASGSAWDSSGSAGGGTEPSGAWGQPAVGWEHSWREPEENRQPEPQPYPGSQPYPGPAPLRDPQPQRTDGSGHSEDPAAAENPAGSTGKAGRNLPVAITVGVLLGAAVIASLFVWRPAFVLLAAIAIAGAIWEMTRAVEPVGARPPLVPLLVGGPAIVVLAWFAGLEAMVLGLVLTVVALLVWRLGEGPAGYQRDVIFATLIAVYVPFLAGFAVLLVRPDDGAIRVTITLAAAVLSDVGGYAMGALFGRHPMAPTVSPKKSWEGFVGSVSFSAVGSAILFVLMLAESWWQGALFGIGVALAATLGDLGESVMKRDLGIKDMGRLLPGHGGLMDRLDSLLFAVPTGYLLLVWFAPPGM